MSLWIGARIRERLRPWKARAKQRKRKRELQEPPVIDDISAEFTPEELQEFLDADLLPTRADPAFKERLRRKLWQQLERRRTGSDEDPSRE
jgi:hypothetical protein